MYFDNVADLLAMDGHGAFVWAAYLVTITVVVLLLVAPGRRRRRLERQIAGEIRRSAGASAAVKEN